jgi:peptidoglycan hydrolase CwlO-like protein
MIDGELIGLAGSFAEEIAEDGVGQDKRNTDEMGQDKIYGDTEETVEDLENRIDALENNVNEIIKEKNETDDGVGTNGQHDFDIEKERARSEPLKKKQKGPHFDPNRREPDFEQWVMDVALGKKDIHED